MNGYSEPLFSLDSEAGDATSPSSSLDASQPRGSKRTGTSQQIEIEAKFTVPAGARMPDLGQVARLGSPTVASLNALYFDTPDLELTRRGITLRRRSGGTDSGWHAKLKTTQTGKKREIHAPIVGARPPWALRSVLPHDLQTDALIPVARLHTRREEIPLLADRGTLLATVCTDHVDVELAPFEEGTRASGRQSWEEVEVELGKGDERVLKHLTHVLRGAGFVAASYGSKIGHALERWPLPPLQEGPVASVLRYARSQVGVIQAEEEGAFRGDSEAVHRSRVAARRLRSTLTTFSALFPGTLSAHLVSELRWFNEVLGGPRDAQVFAKRFRAELGDDETVLREAEDLFSHRVELATADARAELHSPRYELLHDALYELVDPHHFVAEDEWPGFDGDGAWACLTTPLSKTWRRQKHALKLANNLTPGGAAPTSDLLAAWHEVRKAAKAVRYAYEALLGEDDGLVQEWTEVTSGLGRLQDTVVAAHILESFHAERSPLLGDGLVLALQEAQEQERRSLWPQLENASSLVASALRSSLDR